MMRGTYTRGQQNKGQARLNQEKIRKSRELVGKPIVDGGLVGTACEVDRVTGEILVRFPRGRLRAYHPDNAEKLVKKP